MTYWANLATHSQVNYGQLRDFLIRGNYLEADKETRRIFLNITNCASKGYLEQQYVNNIPCIDLRIIDQLWLDYSSGKYGFSVQKKIFEKEYIDSFRKTVGWFGSKSYYIDESKSFARERGKEEYSSLSIIFGYSEEPAGYISGEPILRTHTVCRDTWFEEEDDYFKPSYYKSEGFYPYKSLIYLEGSKRKVTVGNPMKNWGDIGKQFLNLAADLMSGQIRYTEEYHSFEKNVSILEPKGYESSFLKAFYQSLSKCGIH